jgi:hypothetical protein
MRMRLSLCSTIEQLHGVAMQHACYWGGVAEAYKHIVHRLSCMRLFGLRSARVALEASLTSRKRFGTCVIAVKTNLERIVILQTHTRSWVFKGLACSNSPIALAMP